MEVRRIKKQLSAACGCAMARLALNYYMYCEVRSERDKTGEEAQVLAAYEDRYHHLLEGYLEGRQVEEELAGLRRDMAEEMERVTSYADSFQAYEYVMNRLEDRFLPHLAVEREEREEEVLNRYMDYIRAGRDPQIVNERIRELLGQLPVRLTRQKFFAMVEEAMSIYKGTPAEGLEDMLYILRSEALLNQPHRDWKGYEALFSLLIRFKEADYRELTAAGYRELSEDLEKATELVTAFSDGIMVLMELVNNLYLMVLTRPEALMDASEEQRILELLKDLRSCAAGNASMDTIREERLWELEGKQESCLEQWIGETQAETAGRTEEEKRLAWVFKQAEYLMSGSTFADPDQEPAQERLADSAMIKEALEGLFADMTRVWREEPKPVVRGAMAKVLSRLPVFFVSLDQVRSFGENSFMSCTDPDERRASLRMLRMLMEE